MRCGAGDTLVPVHEYRYSQPLVCVPDGKNFDPFVRYTKVHNYISDPVWQNLRKRSNEGGAPGLLCGVNTAIQIESRWSDEEERGKKHEQVAANGALSVCRRKQEICMQKAPGTEARKENAALWM